MAALADVMGVSPEVYRSRASKRRSSLLPLPGCLGARVTRCFFLCREEIMFGSESAFFLEYLAGLRRDGSGGLLVVCALFLLTGQQMGRTEGVCRACVRRRSHTC